MPITAQTPGAHRLELHFPTRAELEHRRRWLLDAKMMSYNAGWQMSYAGYDNETGCIDEPAAEREDFLARYSDPATACYYYLRDVAMGEFVGHAHYRVDENAEAHLGVNIIPARRRQGLGVEALRLLVDRIWADTRAVSANNDFEDDRTGAARIHRAVGFQPGESRLSAGRETRAWSIRRPA